MRKEERNSLEAVIKRRNLHPTHAACDAIIAFAREVLRVARNCFYEISELFCHSTPATSTTARYECEELHCWRLRKEVFSMKMFWMFVTCFTLSRHSFRLMHSLVDGKNPLFTNGYLKCKCRVLLWRFTISCSISKVQQCFYADEECFRDEKNQQRVLFMPYVRFVALSSIYS